ncbi:hypothetical protein Daus18300_012170 [Diaporthe australafricana]|uniref:Uncharacterized protein n=1 Tax=Diaporthe australafricana TaxID=127596 RepID=A0ABR3W3U6_9PEZI
MDFYLGENANASMAQAESAVKLIQKQKAIVICGFAAIGKSTFQAAHEKEYKGIAVEDLDSGGFTKGPEWPSNYLKAIKLRLSEKCILMISTHQTIYSRLIESGVILVMVYPKKELKAEWLERIRQREGRLGAISSICGIVDERWDDWIAGCHQQTGCLKFEMSEGGYIEDCIETVLDLF